MQIMVRTADRLVQTEQLHRPDLVLGGPAALDAQSCIKTKIRGCANDR